MTKNRTVAVGQINTTVGSFSFNEEKIINYSRRAYDQKAGIICFPELAICGYPPLDLLDRPSFVEQNRESLGTIADSVPEELNVLVGYVDRNESGQGKRLYNAAALLRNGSVVNRYYKTLLPTYDVFNEARYFEPGDGPQSLDLEYPAAATICEDIWNDPDFSYDYDHPRYQTNPLALAAEQNPDVVFNLSASPFTKDKDEFRTNMVMRLAEKHGTAIVLSNIVGGNDSLIFDGTSLIVNNNGELLAQGASFGEDLLVADLESEDTIEQEFFPSDARVYLALREGISNYVHKSGYTDVVLGLSGGIDSALTATLAADAIGAENVHGILMPSLTSSESSVTDAEQLADNLGIDTTTVDIGDVFEDYLQLFGENFEEFSGEEDGGIENKNQHRIRGNILTTLSNKLGYLPLCPGNKTELALGYTTLYGDLTGLLAPLADVPKTMVYDLAKWRNTQSKVIPDEILEKAPSAELATDQSDEEDLAPYKVLDEILELFLEERTSREKIIGQGHDEELVDRIIKMIDLSEYKRRQAPTGLKVTSKRNFGGGRIVPEVHHFYLQEYSETEEE